MNYTHISQVELASVEARDKCPAIIKGGFNRSTTVYTVAKKGKLTPVAASYSCKWAGDRPSKVIEVPRAPRILIITTISGNGGWEAARLYS